MAGDLRTSVDGSARSDYVRTVSAQEIVEQIKALPPAERAEVTRFVLQEDDSWIPESFKEGMADIAAGRVVDLDTALTKLNPLPTQGSAPRATLGSVISSFQDCATRKMSKLQRRAVAGPPDRI